LVLGSLGVLGLCIGSFLNVVAYRLPRECMSIARPRSRCPKCAAFIAWYDNFPVVSWLLLKGRCRNCKGKISGRYPLVELGIGGMFVLLAWLLLGGTGALCFPFDHGAAWLECAVALVIASALMALTLIDLDYRILPDEITKPGIWLGPLFAFLAPRFQHERFAVRLFDGGTWGVRANAAVNGILGIAVAGGTLWLIGWLGTKAFKKEAMGFGDVKMIAGMGGVLGAWAFLALAVAAVFGSVVGIIVKLVTKGRYIPFGPFLALGMLVVMVRGSALLDWYLRLLR
jgi:leader peptidase (prepilin peptidase)/N-methyltransferase